MNLALKDLINWNESKILINYLSFLFLVFISLYTASKLNLFMLKDLSYAFRPDNFWSYSSSIYRRGSTGEIVYYLDIITGKGIYIFALLIWSLFVLFLIKFLKEIKGELSLLETLLLVISPFLLLYSVDAEIFTLLPFLTLFSRNKFLNVWGTLFLIVVATLIREISLLFYFPVLVSFIVCGQRHIKLFATIVLFALFLIVLYPKPTPTFLLEQTHWSSLELQDTSLYKFADTPLREVLPKHIGFIMSKWEYFIIPVVCFMLLATSMFYKRTLNVLGALYLFSMISVCFVLTVDYGRYFYLFLIFSTLASSSAVSKHFTTFPAILNFKSLNLLGGSLSKIEANKKYLLLFAVFSPSGFWASAYQIKPRFYTLLAESDFLTTIYTYIFK